MQAAYILDSGLDAGLELPFTCRGGICGACVGRVVEGQVDMSDVRYLLVWIVDHLKYHISFCALSLLLDESLLFLLYNF